MNNFEGMFSIGLVQTTIDAKLAWERAATTPKMSRAQDEYVWVEITKALKTFQDSGETPQLILLPELSLPRTRIDEFERAIGALNCLAIVGVDYLTDPITNTARNQGIAFIPKNFFRGVRSRYCTKVIFGKTYPAPGEERDLKGLSPSWSFKGDGKVYVFDCKQYGRFGVSICYDFMDIERALLYRGQIQHLFVVAYNRDIKTFQSLATSLSRTVFCNVVLCNTGHFGGSLVVSPYDKPHMRTLYSHEGGRLFTTQVIQLPVEELVLAQKDLIGKTVSKEDRLFKDCPPGFKFGNKNKDDNLDLKEHTIL